MTTLRTEEIVGMMAEMLNSTMELSYVMVLYEVSLIKVNKTPIF